ncbi:MAG: hypothetical protein LBK52_03880 [Deltaproteobacteria bacterium]|jgi:type IV secretory pathway VirB10-like protein|nr:hypothetical protein [Deltaproteobacteria bacterium]
MTPANISVPGGGPAGLFWKGVAYIREMPRLFLLIPAVLLGLGLIWPGFSGRRPESGSSAGDFFQAVDLTPREVDGEVGGLGTPEYNRLVEERNVTEAREAEENGISFVPTPVGKDRLTESLPAGPEIPAPEPRPLAPDKPPPSSQPLAQPLPPASPSPIEASSEKKPDLVRLTLEKAVLGELKAILARKEDPLTGPAVVRAEVPAARPEDASASVRSPAGVRSGDIVPASLLTAVNSDYPVPVIAAVTSGPLREARLVGRFEARAEGAVLTFTRLERPGEPPAALEALAVDPRTRSPAMASKVDTHFWSRWGGLTASAFLEGFGTALGSRGSRIYSNGDILIAQEPEKTVRDASLEALGQVGREAASQFRKGFDRPPTVHIQAGQPLGILILSLGRS